ncbi:MAG: hypothetical protein IKR47_03270 [Lachnospiraceae bacterium]|nr:hypothetical protein [Lachnospiraceae bacterium]
MACFLVPTAEAVVTTIATKVIESKERKNLKAEADTESLHVEADKLPFSKKMKWLNNMLWGGSALLAFEHVWHGEVVPFFPFLTAAGDPSSAAEMLHEMATAGVTMAVLVTAVWGCMVAASNYLEKKADEQKKEGAV